MDEQGSWFLPAKCLKNTSGRVTFCPDLPLYLKFHSSTGVFQTFVRKNQLPGFYIRRRLIENGLNTIWSLSSQS